MGQVLHGSATSTAMTVTETEGDRILIHLPGDMGAIPQGYLVAR